MPYYKINRVEGPILRTLEMSGAQAKRAIAKCEYNWVLLITLIIDCMHM